ncbi:MAG: DUF342 domain-containing protein [Lachnospiraceae bacterium]|nr:DUF342 domain-containing protein [Lachnospiraceae bacterium]
MDKGNLTSDIADKDISGRMEQYHSQGFDRMQLEQLEKGLRSGVDVSYYADTGYMFLQMEEIRKGLEQGIDIAPYLDDEYDWFQMREIRRGIKNGIDVSIYLDKNMDYLVMREIRLGLETGINLYPYYERGLEKPVLKEIREAFSDGVSIDLYVDSGYEDDQLEQIRLGLKNNVDITYYLDKDFSGSQMYEIRRGLEEKIDISAYAKPEYNWLQMREIRLGIKSGVDTKWYQEALYSHKQMREIRLGLEEGLDVSSYTSQMWSATDMANHRAKLKAFGKYESDLYNPETEVITYEDNEFSEVKQSADSDDDVWNAENQRVTIEKSPDAMVAYIYLPEIEDEQGFSEKEITTALKLNGIRQGIIKETIYDIISGKKNAGEKILIAEGKLPVDGEDGYFEYFFNRNINRTPELNEDGSVNYSNTVLFEQVDEGQTLAVYHPAVHGVYGYDVTGKLIHPKNGQNLPRITGKNIKLLDDEVTYVATVTGCVEEKPGSISVNTVYVVKGDVSLSSGNIKFDGDVEVKGDVRPRAVIEATGNVIVSGTVEAAFIKAGKDVLVKQGVLGKGIGIIEAGNDVNGKFFENVKIYAERDVKSNYLYNCNCIAMHKVIISGRRGAIVGGITSAVYGVEAAELGNKIGLRTELEVGANQYFIKRLREYDSRTKDLSVKVTIFKEEIKKLQVKIKLDVLKNNPVFQNSQTAMLQLMNEIEAIKEERDAFTNELAKNSASIGIRVAGRAYAGCLININNAKYLLDKDVNKVWFREKEQAIVQLLS